MVYNGSTYFFRKNILGDVTDIYNNVGTRVAGYAYDAWGNCTVLYNSSGLADINPFRYRGYYYDSETGFYYLNSRYYDPEIRRFINADDLELLPLLSQTVGQLNLYAYCNDNPIMYSDEDGTFVISLPVLIGLGIGLVIGAGLGGYTAIQNGAEIWSGDFWLGVLTGAILGGAAGAIVGLGGAFLKGASLSVVSKFTTDLFAYTVSGAPMGTWEDYAVAFISGGITGGLNATNHYFLSLSYDMIARPDKFLYDVFTRAITGFFSGRLAILKILGRGLAKANRHIYKFNQNTIF